MKRFCAGILALATAAGGLFAQEANPDAGKFSWSGSVKLGVDAIWNGKGLPAQINPNEGDGTEARAFMDGRTRTHSDWNQGIATVKYTKGPLELALNAEANYAEGHDGNVRARLDGWAGYGDGINGTESNWKLFTRFRFFTTDGKGFTDLNGGSWGNAIPTLYGYYLLLDRQLRLDAAYKGIEEPLFNEPVDLVGETNYDNFDGVAGVRVSFAPVAVEGLRVGFSFKEGNGNGTPGWFKMQSDNTVYYPDAGEILSSFSFGVKYNKDPLTVAAGFRTNRQQLNKSFNSGFNPMQLSNTWEKVNQPNLLKADDVFNQSVGTFQNWEKAPGVDRVYLGGSYKISDQLSAGLDVQLQDLSSNLHVRDSKGDDQAYTLAHLMLGAKADFNAEPIHAGIAIKLKGDPGKIDDNFGYLAFGSDDGGIFFNSDVGKVRDTFLQFSPYVKYDIIPKTLQFHLPINVAFSLNSAKNVDSLFGHELSSGTSDEDKYTYTGNKGLYLWFAPALYWNLKQDAATDDPACGIVFRYNIGWAFGQIDQDENGKTVYDKNTNWLNGVRCTFRWTF